MMNTIDSDHFLQLIAQHLPDMLWAKDMEGKYLFANRTICERLLMASDTNEPIGKTDVFFALRERATQPHNPNWHTFGELCFNSDTVVLEHRKPMKFEEYGNIKGELTYLEVHKAPFYDENGLLIGVIGSGRDITAHKKAEQALTITNRLIESGPVVVFEWRAEAGWPINFVSSNVTAVFGLDYSKLMSGEVKFSDYVHKQDIERVVQEVNEYLSKKVKSFTQEYRLKLDNDATIWIKDFTIIEYFDNKAPIIKGYIFDNTVEVLAQEKALHFFSYDHLTQLPNRQKLLQDMSEIQPQACAIFNIDSFREINDFFGTTAADNVLAQLSNQLIETKLPVYRIGGDEFAILFYESLTHQQLKVHIETILAHIQSAVFVIEKEVINLRMSVGAALGNTKLLNRADIALHQSKEKKLSISIYEERENIEENYKRNIAMASAIHQALQENRIICYYQPIVDFKGEVKKYEALVRMIDKDDNIVAPIYFLPIAKKTKLYPQITRCVITQACKKFQNSGNEFSINLSIDDINDPYTVQEIIKIMIETDTSNQIVFEILETEGIENYTSVTRFIKQVKALGAKIAIDDFGTGYSNFEHILRLDIDYIKIDGSLVRGVAGDERFRIIIETIHEFAKKMNVKTIAGFVCDEAVYNAINAIGIDYSQGYFTGKPSLL